MFLTLLLKYSVILFFTMGAKIQNTGFAVIIYIFFKIKISCGKSISLFYPKPALVLNKHLDCCKKTL